MKSFLYFFAVAVLLCSATAIEDFDDDKFDLYDLPGVNWTWLSWMAGGPTCHDPSRLVKVDVPDSILQEIGEKATELANGVIQELTQYDVKAGCGVALTYKGKTFFQKFFGVTDNATTVPTEDSMFGLGSINKVMTSYLLALLKEKGVVDPSDLVTKYFNVDHPPVFNVVNPYDPETGSDSITLEALSSQSSGFTHDAACLGESPDCTEDYIVDTQNKVPLFLQPMTRNHYSNYGFPLLGHCLERAASIYWKKNITYQELMKQLIFDPIGMNSTCFNYTDEVKARVPKAWVMKNGALKVSPLYQKNLGWSTPTGGMVTSMKDIMLFLNHLIKNDGPLSPDGLAAYLRPGLTLRDGVSGWSKSGFEDIYANGLRTLHKIGLAAGFADSLTFVPDMDFGGFAWVNVQIPRLPSRIILQSVNFAMEKIGNYIKDHQPPQQVPDEAILGTYSMNGNEILSIKYDGSNLVGHVSTSQVNFYYDEKTTEAYNKANWYVFRYRSQPATFRDSCFFYSNSGFDDSLALFHCEKGDCTATVIEARAKEIPRDRTSSSSNPSKGSDSAGTHLIPGLRLVFITLLIGMGSLLRRPLSLFTFVGVLTVFACACGALYVDDEENNAFANALRDYTERGPAINWVWKSYLDGPRCYDRSNFTLYDLPNNVFKPVFDSLHNDFVASSAAFNNNVAYGIGVVYNGKVIHTDFVGNAKKDVKTPPNENTVFHLGSQSKIFTGLLLSSLADKGILKITDPVTKYYNKNNKPEFNVVNPYNPDAKASSVTLESLASHSSGLPNKVFCEFQDEDCTEDVAIDAVNMIPLYHQPLVRHHYSNIGIALLGRCCERAVRKAMQSNVTYEALMKERIFDKWGMNSSGFDYPADIKARMADGNVISAGKLVPSPDYCKSLHWGNPCGGMYSTTSDMIKFMTHVLDMKRDEVLTTRGYVQYLFPGGPLSDGVSSYGRAGWEVAFANGLRTITKQGTMGGFCSTVVLVPEIKLGIFIWDNAQNSTTQVSALATNKLVSVILTNLEKKQSKPACPVVNEICGSYIGGSGAVEFTISQPNVSSVSNMLFGTIGSTPYWYEYDEKTTTVVNASDTYYFRYFLIANDPDYSCINLAMGGVDNGLIEFKKEAGVWHAIRFDTWTSATKQ